MSHPFISPLQQVILSCFIAFPFQPRLGTPLSSSSVQEASTGQWRQSVVLYLLDSLLVHPKIYFYLAHHKLISWNGKRKTSLIPFDISK